MKHSAVGSRQSGVSSRQSAVSSRQSGVGSRFSRRARRGVTLLEVLVSIFVILGGMLGVAALLPVGRFEMSMCLRADRAGTAGRAALREAQVREMLYPNAWYWNPGLVTPWPDMPVAIDPVGWAANVDKSAVPPAPPPTFLYFPARPSLGPVVMPRVTLKSLVPSSSPGAWMALADGVFTCQDDLRFENPGEKTLRPKQLYRLLYPLPDGTNASSDPNVVVNGSAVAAVRESKYSWMMTIAPADNEYGANAGTRKLYTLSAVVFYSRLLTADGERTCLVDSGSLGPLVGGGDVVLVGADALEARAGQWILLRGSKQVTRINPTTGRPEPAVAYAFRWYRVIAADEFNPSTNKRRLTLAGPDWTDINSWAGNRLWAGIFPGAIGVYTETVELER